MESINIPLKLAEELLAAIISNKLKEKNRADVDADVQERQSEAFAEIDIDTDKKLKGFQISMKELMTRDLLKALIELRNLVDESSDTYNTIILITARLNRLNKYFHKNLVDFNAFEIEMAKIENSVLFIVDNLDKSILNKL